MNNYKADCIAGLEEAIKKYGLHKVIGDPEPIVGLQSYEVKEALVALGYSNNSGKWERNKPEPLALK